MNNNIIQLTLRFVLGLNFLFVPMAHLNLWHFYTEDPTKITSWISSVPVLGNALAIGFLIVSVFLLIGFKTTWSAMSAIALLLINHIALLLTKTETGSMSGPFYNSFHHSVPFITFAIIILYTSTKSNDYSIDNFLGKKENNLNVETKNDIVLLAARLFAGAIFFLQGLGIIKDGVMSFAENVYVNSYATTFIPKFLLWIMGVSNPWILCVGGVLLLIGFKIKWAAYLLSFFLVSIAFGHLLGDPYETSGDISMYGFNNLAFVLLMLWLENGKNKFGVDALFKK
jgi:uncharacterized membrane protein YphA (DoxX/SURF4 family)